MTIIYGNINPPEEGVQLYPEPKNWTLSDYYEFININNSYVYNAATLEEKISDRLKERNTTLHSNGIIPAGDISTEAGLRAVEKQIAEIKLKDRYIPSLEEIIDEIRDEYSEFIKSTPPDKNGLTKSFLSQLIAGTPVELKDFLVKPDFGKRMAFTVGFGIAGLGLGGLLGAGLGGTVLNTGIVGGIQTGVRSYNENEALKILNAPTHDLWKSSIKGALTTAAFTAAVGGAITGFGFLRNKYKPGKTVSENAGPELRNIAYETMKDAYDNDILYKNKVTGIKNNDPVLRDTYEKVNTINDLFYNDRLSYERSKEFIAEELLGRISGRTEQDGGNILSSYYKPFIENIEEGMARSIRNEIYAIGSDDIIEFGFGNGRVTDNILTYAEERVGINAIGPYKIENLSKQSSATIMLRLENAGINSVTDSTGKKIDIPAFAKRNDKNLKSELIKLLKESDYERVYKDKIIASFDKNGKYGDVIRESIVADILGLQHKIRLISGMHKLIGTAKNTKDLTSKFFNYFGHIGQLSRDHNFQSLVGIDGAVKMLKGGKADLNIKQAFFRAITGEKTGVKAAQKLKNVYRSAENYFRREFNKLGLILPSMKEFHFNNWDPLKISADKNAFVSFIMDNADWRKIEENENRIISDKLKVAEDIADTLIKNEKIYRDRKGNVSGVGHNASNSMRGDRFIIWKNGESYWEAMSRFGKTVDPVEVIEAYSANMSSVLAAYETVGEESVMSFFDNYIYPSGSKLNAKIEWNSVRNLFRDSLSVLLDERLGNIEKPFAVRMLDGILSINILKLIGKAGITVFLGDKPTMFMAYKALNIKNAFRETLDLPLSKLSKEDARIMGVLNDTIERYVDVQYSDYFGKASTKIHDVLYKATFLGPITKAMREKFTLVSNVNFAKLSKVNYSELNTVFKNLLTEYGISEAKWNSLKDHIFTFDGVEMINPKIIKREARSDADLQLGIRLSNLINDISEAANPSSSLRSKVFARFPDIIRAERAGNFITAQVFKSVTSFWSAAFAEYYAILKLLKMHYDSGNYGTVGGFFLYKLMMSAARVYVGDILQGKIPDPEDTEFWIRTMSFIGMDPISEMVGHLIVNAVNGTGNTGDFFKALAGPNLNKEINMLDWMFRFASTKSPEWERRYISKTISSVLDEINLTKKIPVVGLIVDRIVFDQLYKALDPDAEKINAERERRDAERGTTYWWKRGEALPGGINEK